MPEENPEDVDQGLPEPEEILPPELPPEEPISPPELPPEEPVAPPELPEGEAVAPPELEDMPDMPDIPADADVPPMPMPAKPFYPGGPLDEIQVIGDAGLEAHGGPDGTAVGGLEEPDEARLFGDIGFWAKITDNAEADAPAQNRWVYAWSEVYKSAAGYDGWTTLENGRSGTTSTDPAYNFIEDMNDGSGTEGNGVDLDNLDTADYTFTIQACPTNNIVWMQEVTVDGTVEYWFAYENGVDGGCD